MRAKIKITEHIAALAQWCRDNSIPMVVVKVYTTKKIYFGTRFIIDDYAPSPAAGRKEAGFTAMFRVLIRPRDRSLLRIRGIEIVEGWNR